MKDLKIGKKLGICFVILLLITTVSNLYTLYNLKEAGRVSHELFEGPYELNTDAMGIRRDLVGISRRINGGFADNEHVETRKLVLAEFDSLEKRIQDIRSGPEKAIENKKISQYLDSIEEYEKQLKQEYEKIYNATQQPNFKGPMTEIDLTGYAQVFTACTETAENLYKEAEKIGADFDKDVSASVKTSQIISTTLNVISIASGVIICIYITRSLKKPIEELEVAANKMAVGDFDIDLNYESKDELGVLSNSMTQMSNKIKDIIEDTVRVLGDVSSGNFNTDTNAEYIGVFKYIEKSINIITNDLSETMEQINIASEEVGAASDQVASGSQMLSQGATEQASAIEELSSTINEISEKIKGTAENAKKANSLTLNAANQVKDGNEQMKEMVKAMEDISFTSNEIGRIIKTIDDIAFQTNILALNAAVEAARAGEAGKGFAVVADEVRNLAAKSAEAAKNTSTLIENSIEAVENGTKIVDNTAQSLQKIINTTSKTTALVNDIAKASEDEANSIAQVTLGVDQISEVVQTNSATSEESAAASEELSGQAQMLKSLIDKFVLKDSNKNIDFDKNEVNYFATND